MNLDLTKKIIPKNYIQQAEDAISSRNKKISILFEQKTCPDEGWDDATIEMLLQNLSLMDSNNFPANCGVGEREARFASSIVERRHFRMGHGIGRSGDIAEVQPKAAGSSLMNKLTNSMVLHLFRHFGVPSCKACFVVPLATGMSLVLCLLAVRKNKPNAKYVLWPRIDQKACFKCICTAGFEVIVIENVLEGDELTTDLSAIQRKIEELSSDNIAAILTTTSCFAPRVPDKLEEVAEICLKFNIAHIINNAYGIQSSKCLHLISHAAKKGRVDAFVQSTDKNFMVPVGGSIIAGFDTKKIDDIAKLYPGRGSSTPTMDLFITLLSLGLKGYGQLLQERRENYNYLKVEIAKVAEKHGERLLDTKHNQISLGITLSRYSENDHDVTKIGSMLFTRCISGTRVISGKERKTINDHLFEGWGAHCNSYHSAYLTAAAAIGMTKNDVDLFVKRLDKVLTKENGELNSEQ